MPDHGRPLRFGAFVTPAAGDAAGVVDMALAAEEAGFDLLGIQDHPYQRRFLDTWTLLSFLAARTERIGLFPDVANLPLRPPRMLAKAAASLDVLSRGRVELGLGAGAFWDGVEQMGGPRRTPGESVDALEEAIGVIRAMWAGEGRGGPPPAHDIGIWLGSYKPRMLRLTARLADGWVPSLSYLPGDELAATVARLDDAARQADREPGAIRRVLNVGGILGEGEVKPGTIVGDADHWARTLATLATDHGFDTFVYWPAEPDPELLRAFARDVIPKVLDVVATFRNP